MNAALLDPRAHAARAVIANVLDCTGPLTDNLELDRQLGAEPQDRADIALGLELQFGRPLRGYRQWRTVGDVVEHAMQPTLDRADREQQARRFDDAPIRRHVACGWCGFTATLNLGIGLVVPTRCPQCSESLVEARTA